MVDSKDPFPSPPSATAVNSPPPSLDPLRLSAAGHSCRPMASPSCPVAVFFFGCLQRLLRHAGTQSEFPSIDTNTEYDGPAIKLLTDNDEERMLMAAKETGISTREDIEGLTTAVDLIDNNNSDDSDESETPSLMDPDLFLSIMTMIDVAAYKAGWST